MLIEILKRTPLWVFVLFFVLLVYGYSQSKSRRVSGRRIAILPAAMILLSFFGVVFAFNIAPVGLISWGIGVWVSIWLGTSFAVPHNVTYSTETQSFFVPGSWLPLILMMAIFSIKYVVGVILARQLPIANTLIFSGSVSFLYGFFGGLFLSRALVVWSSRSRPIEITSNGHSM